MVIFKLLILLLIFYLSHIFFVPLSPFSAFLGRDRVYFLFYLISFIGFFTVTCSYFSVCLRVYSIYMFNLSQSTFRRYTTSHIRNFKYYTSLSPFMLLLLYVLHVIIPKVHHYHFYLNNYFYIGVELQRYKKNIKSTYVVTIFSVLHFSLQSPIPFWYHFLPPTQICLTFLGLKVYGNEFFQLSEKVYNWPLILNNIFAEYRGNIRQEKYDLNAQIKYKYDLYIGQGNGNPLQYSCLENPMDRSLAGHSPWGHKSWTRLSN